MNLLGSGPTGSVVLSRDRTTGTVVAVKYLSKSVYQAPGFAELFRYEAARLVHIDNPHLALIYEYVEEPDGAALVMEFVDGASVRALIDDGGPLDPQPALYVLRGALLGLSEPHRKDIAHRDLRPENLLIDTNAVTKVVDVGIAANLSRKAPAPGDPRYRSPELWAGESATPASDVYAAAATLHELLTGQPPRTATGDFVGQAAAVDDEPPPAFVPPASLPIQIRRLLARGLAHEPEDRARDAAAMLGELDIAALGLYGPGWEKAGKAKLAYRMAALRASRRSGEAAPVEAGTTLTKPLWVRTLVAVGAAVVLGIAAVAFTGVFSSHNNSASGQGIVPVFTHTPIAIPGPTVPPLPGPSATDAVKPDRPVGLHVAGRSQTAVTLDWNLTRDNIRVIGYIISRNGQRIGTSYLPGFTDFNLRPSTRYDYSVVAFDAAGNRSPSSAVVFVLTLTAPDRTPPSVPTGLHSTGRSTTSIVLTWAASRDNIGVAGYDVFRDGVRIGSVLHPGFTDTRRNPATTYRYSVRAFDTSNNASANSPSVAIRTLTTPDKTPPSAPTGVVATGASDTTISVMWHASTDNIGVTGYKVYRDGKFLGTAPGTGFSDYELKASTTYSYTIRAVDAAGNVSKASAAATGKTKDAVSPTPDPTVPPPPPTVQGVSLQAPNFVDCNVTIDAVITTSGAMSNLELDASVDGGAAVPQSVDVDAGGTATVTLGPFDAKSDGTLHVSVSGQADSRSWTAPSECVPVATPTEPTEQPSDPGDTSSPDISITH